MKPIYRIEYTAENRKDLACLWVFTKHVTIFGVEIATVERPYDEDGGRFVPIDIPTRVVSGNGLG